MATAEKATIEAIACIDDFTAWLLTSPASLHVLFTYAEWDEPSKPGGAMDSFFTKMAETFPGVEFAKANAEEAVDVAESLDVSVVPSFYLFKNKVSVDKVEGADAAEVTRRVEKWASASLPSAAGSAPLLSPLRELTKRIEKLVAAAPVMLFMKGRPESPKCKYSRRAVELLQQENITFGSFDILANQAVRQGLKDFANWPTFPMLWAGGKLIGGVDIMVEMKEAGELASIAPKKAEVKAAGELGAVAPTTAAKKTVDVLTPELEARLKALLASAQVLLFMKGSPDVPQCGFSDKMVKLLNKHGIKFNHFDIFTDEEIRSGLKLLSNWPTYPQLYVNGSLVGGLDVVTAMVNDSPDEPLLEQLGLSA